MSESRLPDGSESRVVDVGEFADAVFGQRPVSFARFVGVPEKPNEQLIDANPRLGRAGTTAQRNRSIIEPHLMIMRNIFVPGAAFDRPIGASPEPAPAIIGRGIFRVDDKVDAGSLAEGCARQPKKNFIWLLVGFESVRAFAFTPAPVSPLPKEAGYFGAVPLRAEKEICLEGQKDRRSFRMLAKGQNRRAKLAMRAQGEENILGSLKGARWLITNAQFIVGDRDRNRHIVGADDSVLERRGLRHSFS